MSNVLDYLENLREEKEKRRYNEAVEKTIKLVKEDFDCAISVLHTTKTHIKYLAEGESAPYITQIEFNE